MPHLIESDVKSLISQIKKYDAAINSFTDKYQALPGDIRKNIPKSFGLRYILNFLCDTSRAPRLWGTPYLISKLWSSFK
jgi:hypothetical protein